MTKLKTVSQFMSDKAAQTTRPAKFSRLNEVGLLFALRSRRLQTWWVWSNVYVQSVMLRLIFINIRLERRWHHECSGLMGRKQDFHVNFKLLLKTNVMCNHHLKIRNRIVSLENYCDGLIWWTYLIYKHFNCDQSVYSHMSDLQVPETCTP